MQAPLTSLDPVDWLVFADWSAEYNRAKAERFARKCAKSLLKMLANGTDPRATLYAGRRIGRREVASVPVSANGFVRTSSGRWEWRDRSFSKYVIPVDRAYFYPLVYLQDCYWIPTPKAIWDGQANHRVTAPDAMRNTPADLPVEWQQTRLAFKFWKLLNRRAMGIKEVSDAEGDRV